MSAVYEYQAVVIDDYRDGDTLTADVDLGMHVHSIQRLRVKDLWCAERYTPEGKAATAHSYGLMPDGTQIFIRTFKAHSGSEVETAGRYVADVVLPDGSSFAARMIADGFGTASKHT